MGPLAHDRDTGKAVNIVIVEDDGIAALGMKMALERHGCRVRGIAGHPEAAVALCSSGIDLALVDINLAYGRSGVAFARALHEACGVPCLFVTGHLEEALAAKDAAVGCLGKPFTDLALTMAVDVVRRILANRPPGPIPYGMELYPGWSRARTRWELARAALRQTHRRARSQGPALKSDLQRQSF